MTCITWGLAAFLSLITFPAFAADSDAAGNDHRRKMKSTLAQIEALNKMEGDECVADGECEELPLGDHRCGGPSTYLVYSTNNHDIAVIKKLADDYTTAEKGLNLIEMSSATCGTVRTPDPKCVKNKCIDAKAKK